MTDVSDIVFDMVSTPFKRWTHAERDAWWTAEATKIGFTLEQYKTRFLSRSTPLMDPLHEFHYRTDEEGQPAPRIFLLQIRTNVDGTLYTDNTRND